MFQHPTYRSIKVELNKQPIKNQYKTTLISNYTKSVKFSFVLNVVLPNSIKYIMQNMQKNNIYPNSVVIKEDICKNNNKYDTYKFIKMSIGKLKCYKYILNISNVHSLTLYKFSNTQFLDTIKNLCIEDYSYVNLSKIITNNIYNIKLYDNKWISNIVKLRNVHTLNIEECSKNTNKIMISNVHTFICEQNEYMEIICNAYKINIGYTTDSRYDDYYSYNNDCKTYSKFKMIFAVVLNIMYLNLKNINNIRYAKILNLYYCFDINATKISNVYKLTIDDFGYVDSLTNTIYLNKIHTLILRDFNDENEDNIRYINMLNLSYIHTLVLTDIANILHLIDISNLCNIYELLINECHDKIDKINKILLNKIRHLTVNINELYEISEYQ